MTISRSEQDIMELKEITPSIAPSTFETTQYTRKWRVILAVLLGVTLIGVCLLGFYVSVEARSNEHMLEKEQQRSDNMDTGQGTNPHMAEEVPVPDNHWREDLGACYSAENASCPKSSHTVLLLGIDGLRYDYITPELTPALYYLSKCGVESEGLVPVYPSNTFPNLYSIATGLYSESHGLVDNKMFDPEMNSSYSPGSSENYNPQWYQGEPIWSTLTRQGKRSASYFWVGSDVVGKENPPTHWKKYDKNEKDFSLRIKEVMNWLTLPPAEHISFIATYFNEPDYTSHGSGPFSKEMNKTLREVDRHIDDLMRSIYENDLLHCVDIIVVSDHGMTTLQHKIEIDVDKEQIERSFFWTMGRIQPKDKDSEARILSQLECKSPHLRVARKEHLPNRYHYRNNARIENVILDLAPSYVIPPPKYNKSDTWIPKGVHGYNNIEETMQATFLAIGPSFKVGFKANRFRNIEIYNLMSHLLGVDPAPNNGTQGSLNYILKDSVKMQDPKEAEMSFKETVMSKPFDSVQMSDMEANEENEEKSESLALNDSNLDSCSCVIQHKDNEFHNKTISDVVDVDSRAPLSHLFHQHAPWGSPGYSVPDINEGELKVLIHTNFIIGFTEILNLAVWVSFSITQISLDVTEKLRPKVPAGIQVKPEDVREISHKPGCWKADLRLQRTAQDQCNRANNELYSLKQISQRQLFPEELEDPFLMKSEGHLVSNLSPVYPGFENGARLAMIRSIRRWVPLYGELNIIHGPIFDYDLDGRQDSLSQVSNLKPQAASDFFYIITYCSHNASNAMHSCPDQDLQVLAFTFPNKQTESRCPMNDHDFLRYHLTNVKDIEILTGLRFFKDLNTYEGITLKTTQPIDIWPFEKL